MNRIIKNVNIFVLSIALSSMFLAGCSMNSKNYVGNGENYSDRAPRKLGRGVTNIFSAPLEIPNQAVNLAAENDEPAEQAAGYVGGFFVGFAYGAGRIVSGVYDIVTSPFGGPAAPTMDPDLISSDFMKKVDKRDESFSNITLMSSE
ncbi:exosortase system-associated protein, TIGR04073 family [Maridesulfovibrio zosterae]|uniref:exosortase system-associated protein, TIGR04073 family n=1 Tax=Maridesulfovibrio zosterae TaxID=82171 RepID=UPI00040D6799|nr:exosortase system-associated protein, TIGR04073 family [Maridesulfovibrio zosterae]